MSQQLITTPHTFAAADTWEEIGTIDPNKNHHIDAFYGDVTMGTSTELKFRGVIFMEDTDGPYPFPLKQSQGNKHRILIDEFDIPEFLKGDNTKSATEGKFTWPLNIGNVTPIVKVQAKVKTLGGTPAIINSLNYTKGYAG